MLDLVSTGPTGHRRAPSPAFYTIEDFGASPERGDNSARLQEAVNWASANRRSLHIPAGLYPYARTLVLPRSPAVSLIGESMAHSVLEYHGDGPAITFDSSPKVAERFTLSRFQIDASQSEATMGLHLSNPLDGAGYRWIDLSDLYIQGSRRPGSVGLLGEAAIYATARNVVSRDWSTCIELRRCNLRPSGNVFINCVAHDPGRIGWHLSQECRGFRFIGCRAEANRPGAEVGFLVEGMRRVGRLQDDHVFIGCETEDDWSVADFRFERCRGIKMLGGGPGTNALGNGIDLVDSVHCRLRDLTFKGYGDRYAVTFDATSPGNLLCADINDPRQAGAVLVDPKVTDTTTLDLTFFKV